MNDTEGLPTGWIVTVLDQAVEVHDNLREPVNAKERANRKGEYPYYGATGQVGWIDGYKQDGEYILLGEDGAPFFDSTKAIAYIVSGKCWVNNHAHVLRGIDGVCRNRYLMYALNFTDYRGFANGTTRLKLTQGAMRKLPLRLAPVNEQDRIVAKIEELFSDLDAGVAALERVKANLKRYRASVLKAAVEGRLTERWRADYPDTKPADQLLERILTERRQKWEADQLAKYKAKDKKPPKGWKDKYKEPAKPDTSKLPKLPEEWCWATVGQVGEIQGGIQKQPKRRPKSNAFPFLRVANVHRDRLNLTEVHQIELFSGELDRLRLQAGDMLIVEGNGSKTEIGRSAIWDGSIENCVHQNHIIRVRYAAGPSHYLNTYWNSPSGNSRVMGVAASTSGLYTLSVSKVFSLPIPLPPSDEQDQIISQVDEELSQIAAIMSAIEIGLLRAARLRQSILKRAFEGKLVPQDPADEPAQALLARIAEERAKAAPKKKPAGKKRGRKPKAKQIQGV